MNRDQIAANVRLILSCRGISQVAFARLLGVTRQRVTQMIDHPTKNNLAAISAALGVPVEWLSDPALAGKTVEELRGDGPGRDAGLDGGGAAVMALSRHPMRKNPMKMGGSTGKRNRYQNH